MDKKTSFFNYIQIKRKLIVERRLDLNTSANTHIIDANVPFELYPDKQTDIGCLLIHGLFDSPFSLKELGVYLQGHGIMSKGILLPGHGTRPEDLCTINYQDWIQTVDYGVSALKQEVKKIFLIGYSTGATLALHHAANDKSINGTILLSPAIKLKPYIEFALPAYHYSLAKHLSLWITQEQEKDYAKYTSMPSHPIMELLELTQKLAEKNHHQSHPMLMILSEEDETISSRDATSFFLRFNHPKSQLRLYSGKPKTNEKKDLRIQSLLSYYPEERIKHFSHTALPFSCQNFHYGKTGDYLFASHNNKKHHLYGAFNHLEEKTSEIAYQIKLLPYMYKRLTYNPDFDAMAQQVVSFIQALV